MIEVTQRSVYDWFGRCLHGTEHHHVERWVASSQRHSNAAGLLNRRCEVEHRVQAAIRQDRLDGRYLSRPQRCLILLITVRGTDAVDVVEA